MLECFCKSKPFHPEFGDSPWMASSWKVCNVLLCKMDKIGLSHWQRCSHGSGWAGGGERVTIKKRFFTNGLPPGAAMPVYLRGLGCLPRWYYHPLCLLHSRWMRIRFQQVWRWCLFLTRQIYKASTLKNSVGEADIQRPCQICFSPKQGDKRTLKHTSQIQRTCVYPPNSSKWTQLIIPGAGH